MYIFLFIFALCLFKILNVSYKSKYKRFYGLPGPRELPYIGQSLKFITKDGHRVLQGIWKHNGFPCKFTLNNQDFYFTKNIEDVKVILTHEDSFDKTFIVQSFHIIFPNSLILAPGWCKNNFKLLVLLSDLTLNILVDLWKGKRKYLAKCFNSTILNGFVSIFDKHTKLMMNKELTNKNQEPFIAFQQIVSKTFLATMLGTYLSVDVDIVLAVNRLQEIVMKKIFNPFYYIDFIFNRSTDGKELAKYITDLKRTIDYLFFSENNNNNNEFKEKSGDDPNIGKRLLIDVIKELQEKDILTKQDVWSEIMLFTSAAIDTSSNALANTCCLLGMYPSIQNKLYEEVMMEIGPTKDIDFNDLPNLKYTEQVILESMRLLPPAPYLARRAAKDINIGEIIIPKNCNLLMSVIEIHRDENIYPDPLTFDPDRFLPEEIAKRDPYTFLAFSGGPRNCIGLKYAKVQMKVILANIVRRYKISSKYKSIEEIDFDLGITITTKNMDCSFEPRV